MGLFRFSFYKGHIIVTSIFLAVVLSGASSDSTVEAKESDTLPLDANYSKANAISNYSQTGEAPVSLRPYLSSLGFKVMFPSNWNILSDSGNTFVISPFSRQNASQALMTIILSPVNFYSSKNLMDIVAYHKVKRRFVDLKEMGIRRCRPVSNMRIQGL